MHELNGWEVLGRPVKTKPGVIKPTKRAREGFRSQGFYAKLIPPAGKSIHGYQIYQ